MAARRSWLEIGLRMLGVGVALGWAAVYLIPLAVRIGFSEENANRLPFVAFIAGLCWGLASAISKTAKGLLMFAVAVPLTGAVFWFFGVLLAGLLVGLGVSSDKADYVPVIGFCLGAALVVLPGLLIGSEAAQSFFARRAQRRESRTRRIKTGTPRAPDRSSAK
jgi:hypothetical protein